MFFSIELRFRLLPLTYKHTNSIAYFQVLINMKLYKPLLFLLFFFNYSSCVWAIPLGDLQQDEEFLIESSELNIPSDTIQAKDENTLTSQQNKTLEDAVLESSLMQNTSVNKTGAAAYSSDDKQMPGGEVNEFYLFEQEELDAQKPGLEIYETLAPMLSPELKNDAKKVWAETTDFRDAIDFSSKDSESTELILQQSSREVNLQQSSKEMSLSKWNTVNGSSDNNLPSGAYDKKEPDQVMVRELFDGIYDLIKNTLLIIAGLLIVGKIVSIIVKKIIPDREKRTRKNTRRRRKRRHRTLPELK